MIRRLILAALLACSALPGYAAVGTAVRVYDLSTPTESADTDQLLASVNLTDATTYQLTQPDVPRNVTITVTDTTPSITAGTITINCLDVNGAAITEVLDLAGPTLTFTGTKICATAQTAVTVGVVTLGGAGDETIIIGSGSVVAPIFCATTDATPGQGRIRTVGSSTTVTAVSGSPFGVVRDGDEIVVNVAGTLTRRVISTWNSTTEVIVDSAVNLSANGATGYDFTYRDRTCGTADSVGWMGAGLTETLVFLEFGAISATGGVDYFVQCRAANTSSGLGDGANPTTLLTGNVTQAIVPGNQTTTFDPIVVTEPCAAIRVGFKFGTTDTAGTDSVSAFVVTR